MYGAVCFVASADFDNMPNVILTYCAQEYFHTLQSRYLLFLLIQYECVYVAMMANQTALRSILTKSKFFQEKHLAYLLQLLEQQLVQLVQFMLFLKVQLLC